MVCSIDDRALRRVTEAIDRLDADLKSHPQTAAIGVLEARVAAIWAMVREIDPELARLTSGYARGSAESTAGGGGVTDA